MSIEFQNHQRNHESYCRLSFADKLVDQCEQMLRTLHGITPGTGRPIPQPTVSTQSTQPSSSQSGIDQTAQATNVDKNDNNLTSANRQQAARFMRVNHAGEIMAQALYFGQSLTAGKDNALVAHLFKAADEEADHLRWCQHRITQLGGKTSLCNPVWYFSAFVLGAFAGTFGKGISLGLTAEVEKQVHAHLQSHLDRLSQEDFATRAILTQMQQDEQQHRHNALHDGGEPLPQPAERLMQAMSRVMTTLSYWI